MARIHRLPERDTGYGLTQRQKRILDVIKSAVKKRGYPPSLREIGEAVGLTSPSSVAHQLAALERKGYLRRDPHRPRAIEIVAMPSTTRSRGVRTPPPVPKGITPDDPSSVEDVDETGSGDAQPAPAYVPLLGRIAAGAPILADEAVTDVFPLPRQVVGDGELFLLAVSGVTGTGWWCAVSRAPTTATSWRPCSTARRPSRRSSDATDTSGSCRTTRRTTRSWAMQRSSSAR